MTLMQTWHSATPVPGSDPSPGLPPNVQVQALPSLQGNDLLQVHLLPHALEDADLAERAQREALSQGRRAEELAARVEVLEKQLKVCGEMK